MEREKIKTQMFAHSKGVTYFSKQTERRVLFVLTLVMLAWGVVDYTKDLF